MSLVLFVLATVCSAAAAQPLPDAALELQEVDGGDLDDLLARAATSARRYAEVIQDLTTEETTTILPYDDEGRVTVTGRRVFVSQLMVHRFTHSPGEMEYRHVLSVDGREAGDREMRLQALARELASASSASEERELIDGESRKFGLVRNSLGTSLMGSSLQNSFGDRETFEWAIAGRETIDGMDIILVDYREISPTRLSRGRIARLAGIPELDRIHMRGRLWMDASSGDLWRDEGGYFMEGLPGFSEDLELFQFEYQYARSSFGIFTPERFEFTLGVRIRAFPQGPGDFFPFERRIQQFAPFERFGADVQLFLEEPVP